MADWNERYRRGEHISERPCDLLAKAIEPLQPGRALDIACGAGRHALFLAERGWKTTAVDFSKAAVDIASKRARERGFEIDLQIADLEKGEFEIGRDGYDLICCFFYLQRDLFPHMREGVRSKGIVASAIHMIDESTEIKPMNPAFLLKPGELRAEFDGWEMLHYYEGRRATGERARGEIIARKPL